MAVQENSLLVKELSVTADLLLRSQTLNEIVSQRHIPQKGVGTTFEELHGPKLSRAVSPLRNETALVSPAKINKAKRER